MTNPKHVFRQHSNVGNTCAYTDSSGQMCCGTAQEHVNPDDYGWLKVRVEEPGPTTLNVTPDTYVRSMVMVVRRADPVVSASAALVEMLERDGSIHDGVLRVGTDGRGLGVVEYAIGDHPAGPDYRVLTLKGTDRDR